MELWYIRCCLCKLLLFLFCAFVSLQPTCQAFSISMLNECSGPASLLGWAFGDDIVFEDIWDRERKFHMNRFMLAPVANSYCS